MLKKVFGVIAPLLIGSTVLAGGSGPFRICKEVESQTIDQTTVVLRSSGKTASYSLVATETECTFVGAVINYLYGIKLVLQTPEPGLLDLGVSDSPVLTNGNLTFKDGTRASLLERLGDNFESPRGLRTDLEHTFVHGVHHSGEIKQRIGISNFVSTIRGYSFTSVSDQLPTTRLKKFAN